jgi:SAM-dependent methyltransferase
MVNDATSLLDARWDDLPRIDLATVLDRHSRFVAIATDPWQLYASLGATLADLAGAGIEVSVIVIDARETDDSTTPVERPATRWTRWDLRTEKARAIEGVVCERVARLLDDRTLVFTPTDSKEHPDPAAIPQAVRTAARQQGATVLEYLPLPYFSTIDADQFWSRARWLAPSLRGLRAKEAALNRCNADRERTGECQGALALSRCVAEIVLLPRASGLAAPVAGATVVRRRRHEVAAPFDAMFHDGTEDPWHADDSPYEQRRLALVLACLGRPRYRRIVEIGCATGQLTVALAQRADEVIALDPSPKALAQARRRAGSDAIRWVLGAVPRDFPDVDTDLVVLSEVGYFLDGPDLLATVRVARRHLREGGELIMANWRRATENIPLDGPTVQRQTAAMLDLPRRAQYEDTDLIIEVWGQPASVYDEYRTPDDP